MLMLGQKSSLEQSRYDGKRIEEMVRYTGRLDAGGVGICTARESHLTNSSKTNDTKSITKKDLSAISAHLFGSY